MSNKQRLNGEHNLDSPPIVMAHKLASPVRKGRKEKLGVGDTLNFMGWMVRGGMDV